MLDLFSLITVYQFIKKYFNNILLLFVTSKKILRRKKCSKIDKHFHFCLYFSISYCYICYFTDEQFKFFEPLLGRKSLTYKNGLEARKKRQLVDRSFSHDAVMNYYEHFTQVLFCFFFLGY